LKDYYAILGLTSSAQDAEIKRAYRQLALRYHPDKNKSVEAEAMIQEINEAYEILGDPQQRNLYDQLLSGAIQVVPSTPEPAAPRHRDPRYRPKSAEYIREVRQNSFYTYMRDNLRYAVLISKFTLVFAMICLIDFMLPTRKETYTILNTSKTANERNSAGAFVIYLENGAGVKLSHELEESFIEGDQIDYYTSLLLSIPIKIINQRTDFLTRVPLSFYGNFLFFPVILLATSALGIFYAGEGVEFRFNVGLFNLLFFLFNLYFLNIHKF
jgi:DnaJ domain